MFTTSSSAPVNGLPLSWGGAPQTTGLQRLARPLHRRSHRPMWPHPALRAVAEVHVHECLVRQGHLARQALEVADGFLVQPDRKLPLEALGIWIPDRV